MPITENKIIFEDMGGIYYTDTFQGGTGEMTVSKVVFTADESLIDTRITQRSARHVRTSIILIRDKV